MNGRILVADDDLDNRTIAREVLEAAGLEVVLATNGEEALAVIRAGGLDVVLLDMSMPVLNGWDVARRVREWPALAGLPLIAYTAHGLAGDEVKARAAGCDDYLSKPCLPKDMVGKVRHWIEKSDAAKAA